MSHTLSFRISMLIAISICDGPTMAQTEISREKSESLRPGFTLSSAAFADGGEIPAKYTQLASQYVSPHLRWDHVPAGTVTFALIVHDPDVAIDKKPEDVLHWLIFNIPETVRELSEGVPAKPNLSNGIVQGKNRRGDFGYRGPGAPAPGPHHHYTFELFALDTSLNLGPEATRSDVLKAIEGHILAKAVLVGRFHR